MLDLCINIIIRRGFLGRVSAWSAIVGSDLGIGKVTSQEVDCGLTGAGEAGKADTEIACL